MNAPHRGVYPVGTLTLSELEDEIRSNLGGRTDLDSRLSRFINFAQDMICRQYEFPELEQKTTDTVAEGDEVYVLSSRPRSIRSVRILDGTLSRKLEYIPIRTWDTLIPKPDEWTQERPTHYTYYQNKIELWRIPNDSYTIVIRWSKWPAALSDSGDKSDYDNKDDIIIALATAWAFKSLGEKERMYFWANSAWSQLRASILSEDQQPDRGIVPVPEIKTILGDYWKDPFIKGVR